ncbi:site-specific integrase [Oxalobacter sp. OttesenSCG-928-P03]|nr:site-specific integrase [Oxalobacter sp. OttesenSCG-928-P03]
MGETITGVKAISKTSIEITFMYKGKRCRERIRLAPTPDNLKRAAEHRAAILDAIARGIFDYRRTFPDSKMADQFVDIPGEAITVEQYLEPWLERQAHLKASTYMGYKRTIYTHLIPAFGKIRLSELRRSHVSQWCATLGVSGKTINNRLSVLRTALSDAVRDDILESNVLREWEWKVKERHKDDDDVDPFTMEEQKEILDALPGQFRNFIQFALWTGLRPSEQIALEWGDINWKTGEVDIRRALTSEAISLKVDAETTKTKSGRRRVKLLQPALEALEAQKPYTLKLGKYIFHDPYTNDRWAGSKAMWRPWNRYFPHDKVKYRRQYQTRHTYASMMLTAGEAPAWLAEQMGHKDWTMIARVYAKWIRGAHPDAGSKAEALFGRDLLKE